MLVGSTYAWFTDSVTSSGNVITAGTLDIEAYYYDLYDSNNGKTKTTIKTNLTDDTDYTITADSTDYPNVYTNNQTVSFETSSDIELGDAFITDSNIEPGWSSAKLIKVVNKGSLNAKIKLNFKTTGGTLNPALWYDFVNVGVSGNTYYAIGDFTPRAMTTLSTLAGNTTISLAGTTSGSNYEEVYFMIIYGMYTDAGNQYQGTSFNMDVTVLATQATGEPDGFGNTEYDTDATYSSAVLESVSTAAEVTSALEEGNVAVLTSDVSVKTDSSELATLLTSASGDVNAVIDVSSAALTLTAENSDGCSLAVTNGNSLTIIGSGNSETAELVANNESYTDANIYVETGSSVTLNGVNVSSTGSVLYPCGDAAEVNVINSTITTTGVYCVGTNSASTNNYNVIINIENSTLKANAADYDSCVVMINVVSTLNISNSTIIGQRQGVLVRAGTANITDTIISCSVDNSKISTTWTNETTAPSSNYDTGNEVAMGAVIVGNAKVIGSSAYKADAVLTMRGCTLSYDIDSGNDEYEIGLYMVGDGVNGYSTNVTVSDCTINNKVIAYGGTGTYLTYDISGYTGTVYTTWDTDQWTTGS